MGAEAKRDYTINRFIRQFIDENDKRPSAIADRAGIRRDSFSRIINSKRPIYADELIPIINAAGISLEQIVEAVEKRAG